MTEARAITLCVKHRDPVGFEHLVRQYRREAFVHAVALLGSPEDAEDACQECFSKAFGAMPRLPSLDRFYPWFYRILRNHCLNVLDRRGTRLRHAAEVSRQLEEGSPSQPTAGLIEREDRTQVHDALALLEVEHREILVMKYFSSLSYAEISLRLGIPKGTVMSRLYHARRAFRNTYHAELAIPPEGG